VLSGLVITWGDAPSPVVTREIYVSGEQHILRQRRLRAAERDQPTLVPT